MQRRPNPHGGRDVAGASAEEHFASQQRTLASAAGAVGVWDWNFETNELFVDPGLKSILGFDDREISTRPDDWGSRVHPQDLPLAAAGVKNCIDGITDTYEIEHRMLHKDGSVKWMLSRGSALRASDSSLRRLVGTKVDITERKLAEGKIRESQAVLAASHREIQDLAGRLIASQEIERARIARNLHDDLSQEIPGLNRAGAIRQQLTACPPPPLVRDVLSVQRARSRSPRTSATFRTTCIRACSSTPAWSPPSARIAPRSSAVNGWR